MIVLKPFSLAQFPLLQRWTTDKYLLFQYSGTHFSFPITIEQVANYIKKHPDRKLYFGCTPTGKPFAFGEIIPKKNDPPRLARLLVGEPHLRGKGWGEKFVRRLADETATLYHNKTVDLYVLENNFQAIRCYRKVGFEFIPHASFNQEFDGNSYCLKKMRMIL